MRTGIGEQPLVKYRRAGSRREKGASNIEYAILGSLIAVVIFLVVMNLGNQVRLMFEAVTRVW